MADQPAVFIRDSETNVGGGKGTVLPAALCSSDCPSFTTLRLYDARGERVFIEVDQVPNQTENTSGFLQYDYDNGDDVFIQASSGQLQCGYDRGGNGTTVMQVPYDGTKQRYWALREDQGTIFCEASPDGKTWTTVGSIDLAKAVLGAVSGVRVDIGACANNAAMPGTFVFTNLNGGQPPTGVWCKASSYTDAFPAGAMVPGAAWDRSDTSGNGSFDQMGGAVDFHYGASGSDAYYESSVAYDMTGERVSIEVLSAPPSKQATTFFFVANDGNTDVFWNVGSDVFTCGYDGAQPSQTLWQGPAPALPAWISLRESGGTIYCEILEGSTWKSYGSLVGTVDPKRVDVEIGGSVNGMVGSYASSFAKYNLPPVP
jgi:hypothetical protein